MRFYHGTSVRGWLGILKSGSMDSKKIGDSRVSALYSKFKGNYLTTNRKIAEMYASKVGKGVVIEIEYDPLAPGRVNNFKEQQVAGKDYFVEETPLQVDGPDCTIDTKDPLMSKSKMRGDINKTTEEIHMSENTERDLRRAWQKLDEAFSMPGAVKTGGGPKRIKQVLTRGKKDPNKTRNQFAAHDARIKSGEIPPDAAMFEGGVEGFEDIIDVVIDQSQWGDQLTPEQKQQVKDDVLNNKAYPGSPVTMGNFEAVVDDSIQDVLATSQPPTPAQPGASASMFEESPVDRNKIESIYEFGGQIMDSAEAQGLTLDELQIDTANQRIVSALQGEGMRNPQNLEAIIDDAVADAAYQGGDHADGVGGGIMESINRSLELLKKLKK
jgi:hypothetical protein